MCDGLHKTHSNLSIESIANLRWGNLATSVQGEEERGPTVAYSISLLTFGKKRYCRRRCSFLIIKGLFVIRQRSLKRHRSQGHSLKLQVRFPRRITLHAKGRLTYTPHTPGLALKSFDCNHLLANGTATEAGVKFASLALESSLLEALYSAGRGNKRYLGASELLGLIPFLATRFTQQDNLG